MAIENVEQGYKVVHGCKPSPVDVRDFKVKSSNTLVSALPVAYERHCPRVKNQGEVNSCVAHATSSILEYYNDEKLSTQFIYGIRRKECPEDMGEGMYLADACKIVLKYGDMLEEDCSGNDEIVACFPRAEEALADKRKAERAYRNRIDGYYLCQTDNDIKYAILCYGPVLGCIKWHDGYKLDGAELTFYPESNYGYHAVMIYGWDETGWLIQNSWGTSFGNEGRFHLKYEYGIVEARALIDHNIDDKALVKSCMPIRVAGPIINFVRRLLKRQ